MPFVLCKLGGKVFTVGMSFLSLNEDRGTYPAFSLFSIRILMGFPEPEKPEDSTENAL